MEKETDELVKGFLKDLPEMKRVLIYNTASASFIAIILYLIGELLLRIV